MFRSIARALVATLATLSMTSFGFINAARAHTEDAGPAASTRINKKLDESYLSLRQAIDNAIAVDPWLRGSELNEQALLAEGIAAGELPDPRLSMGLANLATDTLDFDQEPMTQFKMGIAQHFPRGDTRKLQRRQKQEESAAHSLLRQNRKAQIELRVSLLWLDNFLSQQSIALIEQNYHLFEQLVDITHANYITTSGATRQQDVIRAELELSRLNDRLIDLRRQSDAARQALMEWLSPELANKTFPEVLPARSYQSLPEYFGNAGLKPTAFGANPALVQMIQRHPRLQVIDQKLQVAATDVELAKEQYKPEWGVNAAYSYRDDDPFGKDRADFVSLGVTVDVPLFTENRQDQRLKAAGLRRAALQTERDLLLRQLLAASEKAWAELRRLDEREQLYRDHLLPKMHDQADAALAAYTSDGGDFAEVMWARIAELNTQVMALELKVERQKMIANINYFIVGASAESGEHVVTDKAITRTLKERQK